MEPNARSSQGEHDRLVAMLEDVERELKARYPGVVGVAVALKHTGGEFTDDLCFRVYVEEKKPPEELSDEELIPETLRGVKTDVWSAVRDEPLQGSRDTSTHRPLLGGTKVVGGSSGTLGCVAVLTSGEHLGRAVLLSNEHVLYGNGGKKGDPVGQPQVSDCICSACCDIAKNEDAHVLHDCAIALLHEDVHYTNEIKEIGLVAGPGTASVHTAANPYIVRKRGMKTGLTAGRVTSITAQTTDDSGTTRTNLIEVTPNPPHPRFAHKGDSGSVVVNSENEVVGLLRSIDKATETLGYAVRIQFVLGVLPIDIRRSGTPGTIPLGESRAAVTIDESEPDTIRIFENLRDELKETAFGRKTLDLADRFEDEIRELVRRDREVKLAWHRYHGPAFVAHFMRTAKKPGYRAPERLDGVAVENLLIAMAVALQNRGSRELAAAVKASYLDILGWFQGTASLGELVEKANRLDSSDRSGEELPA